MLYQVVLAADCKRAGWRDVIEVGALECPALAGVLDASQALSRSSSPGTGQIAVGVLQRNVLARIQVANRRLEIGEDGLAAGGWDEVLAGPDVNAQVEVQRLIYGHQEFSALQFPVHQGKVNHIAVRYVAGLVVVHGHPGRQLRLRVHLPDLDVQARPGPVPGIAHPAAVIALHVHQEVVRVIGLENVGVDVGAVKGPGKDVLPGQFNAAPEVKVIVHLPHLLSPDARRVRPALS